MVELKTLIKNTEERYISYKKLLGEIYKIPDIPEWYKDVLRDNKNTEEKLLKKLVEEKSFENEGLNPPFCYNYRKLKNEID